MNEQSDIAATLGLESAHPRRWRARLLGGALLLVLLAVFLYWGSRDDEAALQYRTEAARRGDLTVIVTATGNLEPTNQVEVGTEISGTVAAVEVDYNDRVATGQVLARIDTTRLTAQVLQGRAGLESARQRVNVAKATVEETRIRASRCEALLAERLCSQEDADTARAAYVRAQAEQASAEAAVAQAQAALDAIEVDLGRAVIYSPIDGVILMREVDPGQTVAASLQAPRLFVIAEDLTRMELHVEVDEADVGLVQEGQQATFAVDAFRDREFSARITQVRYGANDNEGVITYETLLDVDNSELLLRPGMTATAEIVVAQRELALLVPNSALRFVPPVQQQAAGGGGGGILGALVPRAPRSMIGQGRRAANAGSQTVYVLRDGAPAAVPVRIGATDGSWTEIVEGELETGALVIVEAVAAP